MSSFYPHPSRARIAALSLALFSVVAVSGCESQAAAIRPVAGTTPPDATGTQASDPATPVSSPTASSATAPRSTTPRSTAPRSKPSRVAAPPSTAVLVLAPTGIGGLSLGMSKSAALATGMLAGPDAKVQGSTECRVYDGRRGVDLVYFSGGKVEIISVQSWVRTDKGIGVGATYRALHQQYPGAVDDADVGRVYGVASGAPIKAHYRFELSGTHSFPDSKVTSTALQGDDQPCYE